VADDTGFKITFASTDVGDFTSETARLSGYSQPERYIFLLKTRFSQLLE
jgi:hypothetical protein